ncbi:molybdenum ABC transporter permease [Peptococcaceae bacterium SCADC1_2_3]|nr:molybdenum ABC transporter permease [Peptococcaceae bacterium SCADC1_2_3]KFI37935.1 molybdenum ABC transporter permease [Peptococcaceae bacterium SCADC1_2_3]HBQ28729.1 molybdenum ABC transporter permease [Desulfotomaculum sp.]
MKKRHVETIYFISLFTSLITFFFIVYPIFNTISLTKGSMLWVTLRDISLMHPVYLSILASTITAVVSLFLGVPLAYLLARKDFKGKGLLESIVDLPVVIPHPVAGICLLTVVSPNCWVGRLLERSGIEVVGTLTGIVMAMTFVSIPFLINAARESFENIPWRLENVSRTLGATQTQAFFTVTLPLAKKGIVNGLIMTWARAIGEFGAVIILAYHPLIAPTKIYETFLFYGLFQAIPLTAIMLIVCLGLFFLARLLTQRKRSS